MVRNKIPFIYTYFSKMISGLEKSIDELRD
jgi:hypothetical protein